MDLDRIIDFTDEAHDEVGRYRVNFILSPKNMMTDSYAIADLKWDSISYGEEEVEKVPDDKRGIYAFVICRNNDVFPPHGYVLYIGIAGRHSARTLRDRYKDYLDTTKVRSRARIARMIGDWYQVLHFYFAPIDDNVSLDELMELERQLNTALMPPFSVGDLEAEIKEMRRAFN